MHLKMASTICSGPQDSHIHTIYFILVGLNLKKIVFVPPMPSNIVNAAVNIVDRSMLVRV